MYKIVIPSHNRADILLNKTIKYLSKTDVVLSNIYVFVLNNEYDEYRKVLPPLINIIRNPTHCIGIQYQRNFIRDYFDKDEYIIRFDDDIEELGILNNKNEPMPFYNLHGFFEYAFDVLCDNLTTLWGFNNSSNPFFLKNRPSVYLKSNYVRSGVCGYINDKDMLITNIYDDVQHSLYVRNNNNIIVRFDRIFLKTKQCKQGGFVEIRKNKKKYYEYTLDLMKEYPQYIKEIVEQNNYIPYKFIF
tara:strand:+ start:85 stop:819 length:735 start_codon:yes stop_codon:yes gene_type:complete